MLATAQGKLIRRLGGHSPGITVVAGAPRGSFLATVVELHVWRSDGKLLHKRRVGDAKAAFARDGRTLVLDTTSEGPAEGQPCFASQVKMDRGPPPADPPGGVSTTRSSRSGR